jgi:hypothetical protein
MAGLLGGCGSAEPTSSPAGLRDDRRGALVEAVTLRDIIGTEALAVSGRLYVAVVGRRTANDPDGPTAVEVVSRPATAGAAWRREPAVPVRISGGGGLSLAARGGLPCIGYNSAASTPYVACLQDRRWQPDALESLLTAGGVFNQLADGGGGLLALVMDPRRQSHRVLREVGGRWRQLGPWVPSRSGIARLGMASDAGIPDLAMEEVGRPPHTRTIYRYREGDWQRLSPQLGDIGMGPMPGGPARIQDRRYLAVTDATDQGAWPFSVYTMRPSERWRQWGRGALNRGRGSAQGQLSVAGGIAWASWQENASSGPGSERGRFATAIYAVDLTGRPGTTTAIWRGSTAGPANVRVIGEGDEAWVVCLVSARDGRQVPFVRRLR